MLESGGETHGWWSRIEYFVCKIQSDSNIQKSDQIYQFDHLSGNAVSLVMMY